MSRDPVDPRTGPGVATPPGACVHCPAAPRKVVTINAKAPTTQPVRRTWAVPPPKAFHEFSSSSAVKPMDSDRPIVLVRNCGAIQLEAITDPPHQQDVAWAVLPNPGPNPLPALSARTGLHSTLTTNASGGYAVSATLDGTTVFLNVVFVDVVIRESKMQTGGDLKDDSNGQQVVIHTGLFDLLDPSHCAMWVQAKIEVLVGGQPELDQFRTKIHVGFAQNIDSSNWAATFQPPAPGGREGHERIRFARAGSPDAPWDPVPTVLDRDLKDIGFPVLDAGADPAGGNSIFATHESSDPDLLVGIMQTVTGADQDPGALVVTACDSPTLVFDAFLPEFGPGDTIMRTRQLLKTSGVIMFTKYLIAFSDDANLSYVAFAHAKWQLDVGGSVNWFVTDTGNPKWIKGSANANGDQQLTEISHGQEARAAGCEVCGPIALKVEHRDAHG